MTFSIRKLELTDGTFGTITGVFRSGTIHLEKAQAGVAVFGGYVDLAPGRYLARITFDQTSERSGSGVFEACSGRGSAILSRLYFNFNESFQECFLDLIFELKEFTIDAEFRILNQEGITATITDISLLKLSLTPPAPSLPSSRRSTNYGTLSILYFSCHEILEYDELRILTSLGHRVFSTGFFSDPYSTTHLREPREEFYQQDFIDYYKRKGLTKSFIRRFDVIIVMHEVRFVRTVLDLDPDARIVYRSIGQSTLSLENELRPYINNIKVVRYSEGERSINGFLPADDVIYFGKFLSDFYLSNEDGVEVVTFHSGYPARTNLCVPTLPEYERIASSIPLKLYGASNQDLSFSCGVAPPSLQNEIFRACGIYFYVYSVPPSYTLSFVEAMGFGVPIIAPSWNYIASSIDRELMDKISLTRERYEVPGLLDHDDNLLYDDIDDAIVKIRNIQADLNYRRSISLRLRRRFACTFNAETIAGQWGKLLEDMIDR